MPSGRQHAVQLDTMRPLKFTTNAMRLLDKELGKEYGRGFMYFLQRFPTSEENVEQADLNLDVLISALKHGLAAGMRGRPNAEQVARWMDADSAMPEGEMWAAVVDAYMDARGLGWEEEPEEPEIAEDGDEGNLPGPAEPSPETSART